MKSSTLLILVTSLVAIGCDATAKTEPANSGSQRELLLTALQSSSAGKALASQELDATAPVWRAEDLLRVPESADAGPDLSAPQRSARAFSAEPVDFVEQRANGFDVFKNETGLTTLKVKPSRGILKYLRAYEPLAPNAIAYSSDQADEDARNIFNALGLPDDQRGFEVNTSIVLRQGLSGAPTVSARHVRIHRRINGLRVRNSRFMVTFDLNGGISMLVSEWPAFRLGQTTTLHSRAEALDALSDVLAKRFSDPQPIKELTAELAYHRTSDGTFEPVLTVSIFDVVVDDTPDSPQSFEYSLVRGLLEKS